MASCKVKERNEGGGMRLRNCYLRSDPVRALCYLRSDPVRAPSGPLTPGSSDSVSAACKGGGMAWQPAPCHDAAKAGLAKAGPPWYCPQMAPMDAGGETGSRRSHRTPAANLDAYMEVARK